MKSETWWRIGVGALLFVGMFWMFYSEVKAWQTAIAALLGFSGLIAAVVVSAKKQRDRDDHIRNQEIQAMARGLKSEIYNITRSLKASTDAIEEMTSKMSLSKQVTVPVVIFKEMYAPPTPQLYERCLEKIGFLPDKTSEQVMSYYDNLTTVKNTFSAMVRAYADRMDLENAQHITDIYEDLSAPAQAAMALLDQFLEKNGGDAA